MKLINFSFMIYFSSVFSIYGIQIDYQQANKNDPKLLELGQVPRGKGILVWMKNAAMEPSMIYEGKQRGKGFSEPFSNALILELRKFKIPVYVDYFTTAKGGFYRKTPGYTVCGTSSVSYRRYRQSFLTLSEQKFRAEGFDNKFTLISIPIRITYPVTLIGIAQKKRQLFSKHLWKNTDIYNIKSILDDANLYTTHITDQASIINQFIFDKNGNLYPQYKKRVYDFVASNSIQITLMLNANRMDYADMRFDINFHAKKINIPEEKIQFAYASQVHPDTITSEDYYLGFLRCNSDDLQLIKRIMEIINPVIKNNRTNREFWEKVLKQFAIDFQVPYESPDTFYFTKDSMKMKKEMDSGKFDLYHFTK